MSVADRLAGLSPEQRALFEKLREKQRKAAARPSQPPPVQRVTGPTGEGDWPLSLDQERFWFMEQLYPGSAGLNITAATRMRGPVSVPAMGAALDEVVRRHAAWRTTFPVLDGVPVQRVLPPRSQPLALVDLSGLPEERREPEVLRLVAEATAAPFALEGSLVRSAFVRLGLRDHVCVLTVHHLVTDFISFQIAFSELAALYAGSSALPALPIQYPDFAVWQRGWLQGEALQELASWWQERLSGFPLALELPTDRPRPAVARMRGGRRVVGASRELSEALRGLGRREGTTLFMTVLASVAALLHRLSGQEKLILGANNANRNRPELEPVLGCFLTQVPFPIDLTGDPSFRELLARVRQSALGSFAHQDLPFGKLVEAIRPERDTSRQPVVQALVQVLDGQPSKAELAGVTFEPVDAHDGNARYDLMLTLFDHPGGLAGSLEFDADLFDPATAERLAGLLFLQAGRAAADPELRLSELPVLSEAERHQALVEWNGTARPLPGWTLPERFAAQAARAPEAVAVISGAERLTYGEIDRRSDELAHRLRAAGVEPDSRVALLLGRTPDVPVAILAAWKAGAAYVPLDPEWPAERLEMVIEDAEPAILVHHGPLPAFLDVPALDLAAPGIPGDGELPAFRSDRLAYLIYTSGTTGKPKAVMVEHGSVAAMVGAVLDRIGAGPDDRVPHLSRYTFDVTLLEIFVPLVAGGTCEIVQADEVLDGFLAVLERSTRVFTVPALLRRAVAEAQGRRFDGLRTLTSGGDLTPPDLLEELLAAFPSTEVEVLYGPTETAIVCTGHRLSRTQRPERALIGRPLDGVEARVMDPRGKPVPLGVPGELWIGGPGVARGYFRRDPLTAERFVEVDGRRFYRTGDLVRQVPAEGGELEFLGRVDEQVKVRGFRIEPGEVEAALLDHPAVREAAVIALPSGSDKQLVAYVVGTDDAEALRTFLQGRLPGYMVPALFVPLDALPISAHGKVDRKALPAPGAAREALEALAGSAAPRNPREELLAGIWREALGLERVGIHDNFFQLGGDSILSIQVVARARRAGLLLTTRQFFDNQTIAGLAAVAGTSEVVAEVQEEIEGDVPLTPIQRRFFAEGRREPWRFNQAVLLASPHLEAVPLAAVLDRLARHHDALRLRFVREADGGWRQHYAPAASVPFLEVDLPPEALESAVEQLQSGLDLENGPLFTAALFHLGAEDRLLLTAHHLVADAVSWRVLLEDLTSSFIQRELPPKTTSWKRWAELLMASSNDDEIPYWQATPSVAPLPVASDLDGAQATVSVELGRRETRALLQDAPEVYRTQVNDLLLAALARAFAAWTGERTLLVELEGHGREEVFPGVDLSRTVGWFTTLFPVALTLPPGAGPKESIQAVKETLRAVPRRGLGYGLLRDRLSIPEPQVSFNYLGRFGAPAGDTGAFTFAPEAVRGAEGEAVPGRHLFAVDLLVLDDRLRVTWSYDSGHHLPATAERLAHSFLAELEALVAHCLSPEAGGYTPSDFPLAGLDQVALDKLERGVEDLYPLAPLQEGILFHSLYAPGADPYLEQFTAQLEGPLDAPAFAAAWQRAVDRHTALRTAFLWQDVDRPLQLVRREAELPWTVQDWQGEAWWDDLLAADRARGFDLGQAPLMRLTLVRTDHHSHRSHRLVWTAHHLIFDGWGFPLILSEVFSAYQNPGVQLPPARPYRDYIAWLAHRDESEAERHWREVLRGFTEPTAIPFDHAAGEEDAFERSAALPAGELEALAQRLQVTLNTLIQGAWALLLSRYAQAADVVFGAVVSGRPAELPGVESIVGLFINTVPVRVNVPEDEPASAWLARLQADQLGLRQYQWTPLSRVQALSEAPAGEPLFASLLAFENYPVDPSVSAHLGELRIVGVELAERTNYPLGLSVVARDGGLSLRLSAHRRFEPVTVERLLAHLVNLLQALAADPGRAPRELPMLSEEARHQALLEWNDTARPLPGWTLPERFAAQAAAAPTSVAVIAGAERLTYGEIDRRSDDLAHRLQAAGVGPDSRVALLLGRTPDVPVAILAAWKAGAAYVPLDPEWPAERLEMVIEDAEPAILVHRGRLPAPLAVPALDLAEPGAPVGNEELPGFRSDRLAYLIYTSGTTGRPKAVMVEHGSVAAMLAAVLDRIGAGPDDRVPQLSRYTFDVTLLEMFVPLLSGGACEIVDADEILDPAGFLAVLERSTRIFIVPALLRRAAAAARDRGPQRFAGLRTIVAGGDLVTPDLLEELLAVFPSTEIQVMYGPTETAIVCTGHRLSRTGRTERALIGRPLDGVEARVMDPHGELVPLGVPGELWIGGPGVARGYFRRGPLTAERFVEVDGRRFYRTGDLVRQVPAEGGELEFLGRVDEQVKVRGFRIEPGEIEAALLDHPAVREAAVVALPSGGDKQLVAYVVGTDDAEALRAFLQGRLPDYMVPAAFIPLDALPVNAHGKVDRKALPAPGAAREALAGSAAPRNAREELLAGIWREVLGLERVGIHDNFFELGGDSILSIQIVARARRAGLLLTTRQFFDNQTVAGIAAVAGTSEVLAEVQEEIEGDVPLTPIQRRFFEESRQEPWRFNQAVLLASPHLETAQLAAALDRLTRHHDALRLRFVREAGGWRQHYAPATPVPLLEVELPPEALESAVEQLQSGLDLENGPLFTAALFRLGAEDRLLLTAHHLIVDAVSWRVLLEDLTAVELPPKTTSWKRWAKQLDAYGRSPELAEELPYWSAVPAVPPLPMDFGRDGGRAAITVELGTAETRALLRDAPEAYRTQVNDLLLAALARACAAWTGERTLLVDLEGHGREEIFPGVDLSRTVGWFTTLFPVALRLPPGAGPRESILAVKEALRAVPGRGLGYGLLRERLSLPQPQVSFNYLGRFDAPAGPAGEAGLFGFAPEAVRGTGGRPWPAATCSGST